ncbi:Ankyrin repeat-containing domain protein [Elaphomyces granulatus]
MPLFDLPVEILLNISDHLDDVGMNALARTNKDAHGLLNELLYRREIMTRPPHRLRYKSWSWSLTWAIIYGKGEVGTIQQAIHASRYFNPVPECFHIALQLATDCGHMPVVELLLKVKGINPNFHGSSYLFKAPLLMAAYNGDSAMVELLLANVDIDPNIRQPRSGATPLLYACLWGNVSIMRQLLARTNIDVNCKGKPYGREVTPLTAACINHKSVLEMVHMELHTNFHGLFDRHERAALSQAAAYIERPPLLEVSKLLLEREDIDINLPDIDGRTALFWACHHNCLELVDLLLEKDSIDPNVRDIDSGHTPLAEACCVGSSAIVRSLLSHRDTDPNAVDINGFSPLAQACRAPSSAAIVRSLLSHRDTDPNATDNNGISPLAHFMENDYYDDAPEIEALLLAAGATISERRIYDVSPVVQYRCVMLELVRAPKMEDHIL